MQLPVHAAKLAQEAGNSSSLLAFLSSHRRTAMSSLPKYRMSSTVCPYRGTGMKLYEVPDTVFEKLQIRLKCDTVKFPRNSPLQAVRIILCIARRTRA